MSLLMNIRQKQAKNQALKFLSQITIEIYKFQAGVTPPIICDLFVTRKNKYNLRNFQALEYLQNRTVTFGTETISYRGPQI